MPTYVLKAHLRADGEVCDCLEGFAFISDYEETGGYAQCDTCDGWVPTRIVPVAIRNTERVLATYKGVAYTDHKALDKACEANGHAVLSNGDSSWLRHLEQVDDDANDYAVESGFTDWDHMQRVIRERGKEQRDYNAATREKHARAQGHEGDIDHNAFATALPNKPIMVGAS